MSHHKIDTAKARALINTAALSAGVIQQAARGERDDLQPDAVARHAREINDLLVQLSAILTPPRPKNDPPVYIDGHYAGD
ncbi:MAG: hypothetical protein ACLQVF_32120 [Isosphaeraceae bacterium]